MNSDGLDIYPSIRRIELADSKDFLEVLFRQHVTYGETQLFRGQSNYAWPLLPKVLRERSDELLIRAARGIAIPRDHLNREWSRTLLEVNAIARFCRVAAHQGLSLPITDQAFSKISTNSAINDFTLGLTDWIGDEYLSVAALAQHHGIPTRLLDWSRDPFVAALFACMNRPSSSTQGEQIVVWALDPLCVADKQSSKGQAFKIVKPPYFGNPNLAAQKGVFVLWSSIPNTHVRRADGSYSTELSQVVSREPLEDFVHSLENPINVPMMTAYTMNREHADELRATLRKIGYAEGRIFPGYGGVADEVLSGGGSWWD